MAKSSYRRAVRRGPKNQLWTVVVVVNSPVSVDADAAFASPVIDSDWVRSSAASEKATLLRMRGWWGARALSTTPTGGAVYLYALLSDDDAPTVPADDPFTYAEEDILWTDGWVVPDANIDMGAGGQQPNITKPIDVKAMRKIRSGQAVDFVVSNKADNSIEISCVIRALIRLGGN